MVFQRASSRSSRGAAPPDTNFIDRVREGEPPWLVCARVRAAVHAQRRRVVPERDSGPQRERGVGARRLGAHVAERRRRRRDNMWLGARGRRPAGGAASDAPAGRRRSAAVGERELHVALPRRGAGGVAGHDGVRRDERRVLGGGIRAAREPRPLRARGRRHRGRGGAAARPRGVANEPGGPRRAPLRGGPPPRRRRRARVADALVGAGVAGEPAGGRQDADGGAAPVVLRGLGLRAVHVGVPAVPAPRPAAQRGGRVRGDPEPRRRRVRRRRAGLVRRARHGLPHEPPPRPRRLPRRPPRDGRHARRRLPCRGRERRATSRRLARKERVPQKRETPRRLAVASAVLVVGGEAAAAGSGIPEAKAYLNGVNYSRYLALRCGAVEAGAGNG